MAKIISESTTTFEETKLSPAGMFSVFGLEMLTGNSSQKAVVDKSDNRLTRYRCCLFDKDIAISVSGTLMYLLITPYYISGRMAVYNIS